VLEERIEGGGPRRELGSDVGRKEMERCCEARPCSLVTSSIQRLFGCVPALA